MLHCRWPCSQVVSFHSTCGPWSVDDTKSIYGLVRKTLDFHSLTLNKSFHKPVPSTVCVQFWQERKQKITEDENTITARDKHATLLPADNDSLLFHFSSNDWRQYCGFLVTVQYIHTPTWVWWCLRKLYSHGTSMFEYTSNIGPFEPLITRAESYTANNILAPCSSAVKILGSLCPGHWFHVAIYITWASCYSPHWKQTVCLVGWPLPGLLLFSPWPALGSAVARKDGASLQIFTVSVVDRHTAKKCWDLLFRLQ